MTYMSEDVEALRDRLVAADEAYRTAAERVAAVGGTGVEQLPDLLTKFTSILATYEERATGSGDFRGYLEFRGRLATYVEELPEDLPGREGFEEAQEQLEQRRLSQSDFDAAREALTPVQDLVDRLEERDRTAEELRQVRSDAMTRLRELDAEIDRLERLAGYRDIDLDRDLETIREPIESYNEAVTAAFSEYRRESPVRDVLDLFDLADRYPLVPLEPPPPGIVQAVTDGGFDHLPVPTLLEYADYSRSKLDHYVDDPETLREAVAEDRLYLERLGPDPFTVHWPPAPASELRWKLPELLSVVNRFADDTTVQRLRQVQAVIRNEKRYEELRTIAHARENLDENDRERLASGEVEASLTSHRAARDRLQETLDDIATP